MAIVTLLRQDIQDEFKSIAPGEDQGEKVVTEALDIIDRMCQERTQSDWSRLQYLMSFPPLDMAPTSLHTNVTTLNDALLNHRLALLVLHNRDNIRSRLNPDTTDLRLRSMKAVAAPSLTLDPSVLKSIRTVLQHLEEATELPEPDLMELSIIADLLCSDVEVAAEQSNDERLQRVSAIMKKAVLGLNDLDLVGVDKLVDALPENIKQKVICWTRAAQLYAKGLGFAPLSLQHVLIYTLTYAKVQELESADRLRSWLQHYDSGIGTWIVAEMLDRQKQAWYGKREDLIFGSYRCHFNARFGLVELYQRRHEEDYLYAIVMDRKPSWLAAARLLELMESQLWFMDPPQTKRLVGAQANLADFRNYEAVGPLYRIEICLETANLSARVTESTVTRPTPIRLKFSEVTRITSLFTLTQLCTEACRSRDTPALIVAQLLWSQRDKAVPLNGTVKYTFNRRFCTREIWGKEGSEWFLLAVIWREKELTRLSKIRICQLLKSRGPNQTTYVWDGRFNLADTGNYSTLIWGCPQKVPVIAVDVLFPSSIKSYTTSEVEETLAQVERCVAAAPTILEDSKWVKMTTRAGETYSQMGPEAYRHTTDAGTPDATASEDPEYKSFDDEVFEERVSRETSQKMSQESVTHGMSQTGDLLDAASQTPRQSVDGLEAQVLAQALPQLTTVASLLASRAVSQMTDLLSKMETMLHVVKPEDQSLITPDSTEQMTSQFVSQLASQLASQSLAPDAEPPVASQVVSQIADFATQMGSQMATEVANGGSSMSSAMTSQVAEFASRMASHMIVPSQSPMASQTVETETSAPLHQTLSRSLFGLLTQNLQHTFEKLSGSKSRQTFPQTTSATRSLLPETSAGWLATPETNIQLPSGEPVQAVLLKSSEVLPAESQTSSQLPTDAFDVSRLREDADVGHHKLLRKSPEFLEPQEEQVADWTDRAQTGSNDSAPQCEPSPLPTTDSPPEALQASVVSNSPNGHASTVPSVPEAPNEPGRCSSYEGGPPAPEIWMPRFAKPAVAKAFITHKKKVDGVLVSITAPEAAQLRNPSEKHVVVVEWLQANQEALVRVPSPPKAVRKTATKSEITRAYPLCVWHTLRGYYEKHGEAPDWRVWYEGMETQVTLVFTTMGRYSMELRSENGLGQVHIAPITQLVLPVCPDGAGLSGPTSESRAVRRLRSDLKAEIDQFVRCLQMLGPSQVHAFRRVRKRRPSLEDVHMSISAGDDCFAPLFQRYGTLDFGKLKRVLTEAELEQKVAALNAARLKRDCYTHMPAEIKSDVDAIIEVVTAWRRQKEEYKCFKSAIETVVSAQTAPLREMMTKLEADLLSQGEPLTEDKVQGVADLFDAAFKDLVNDNPFLARICKMTFAAPESLATEITESGWAEADLDPHTYASCKTLYQEIHDRYQKYLPYLLYSDDVDLEELTSQVALVRSFWAELKVAVEKAPIAAIGLLGAPRSDSLILFGALDQQERSLLPQRMAADLTASKRKLLLPVPATRLPPKLQFRALKLQWLSCQRWLWIVTNMVHTPTKLAFEYKVGDAQQRQRADRATFHETREGDVCHFPVKLGLESGHKKLLLQAQQTLESQIRRLCNKLRNFHNDPMPLPLAEGGGEVDAGSLSPGQMSPVLPQPPKPAPLVVEVLEGFAESPKGGSRGRTDSRRRSQSRRRRSVSAAPPPLPALPQLESKTLASAAVKLEPRNPSRLRAQSPLIGHPKSKLLEAKQAEGKEADKVELQPKSSPLVVKYPASRGRDFRSPVSARSSAETIRPVSPNRRGRQSPWDSHTATTPKRAEHDKTAQKRTREEGGRTGRKEAEKRSETSRGQHEKATRRDPYKAEPPKSPTKCSAGPPSHEVNLLQGPPREGPPTLREIEVVSPGRPPRDPSLVHRIRSRTRLHTGTRESFVSVFSCEETRKTKPEVQDMPPGMSPHVTQHSFFSSFLDPLHQSSQESLEDESAPPGFESYFDPVSPSPLMSSIPSALDQLLMTDPNIINQCQFFGADKPANGDSFASLVPSDILAELEALESPRKFRPH
eukprot:Blabericola_migrator_1__149@NODE_103_length_14287_cov_84_885584_g91_i0_p1_GENE_NODE_103_length_14287_cov_84_885584_g91_i0NODE_103_length_14287_cov_84_885584_g91_i0_p1_ORF_typecomplete_len2030_score360_23_NODE_103_length_14287_cov_84_885584_g91_i0440910498